MNINSSDEPEETELAETSIKPVVESDIPAVPHEAAADALPHEEHDDEGTHHPPPSSPLPPATPTITDVPPPTGVIEGQEGATTAVVPDPRQHAEDSLNVSKGATEEPAANSEEQQGQQQEEVEAATVPAPSKNENVEEMIISDVEPSTNSNIETAMTATVNTAMEVTTTVEALANSSDGTAPSVTDVVANAARVAADMADVTNTEEAVTAAVQVSNNIIESPQPPMMAHVDGDVVMTEASVNNDPTPRTKVEETHIMATKPPEDSTPQPSERDVVFGGNHQGTGNILLHSLVHMHHVLWQLKREELDEKGDVPWSEKEEEVTKMADSIVDLLFKGKPAELAGTNGVPRHFMKPKGNFFMMQQDDAKQARVLSYEEAKAEVLRLLRMEFARKDIGKLELTSSPYKEFKTELQKLKEQQDTTTAELAPEPKDVVLLPCDDEGNDKFSDKMYDHQATNRTVLSLTSSNVTSKTISPESKVEAAFFVFKDVLETPVDVPSNDGKVPGIDISQGQVTDVSAVPNTVEATASTASTEEQGTVTVTETTVATTTATVDTENDKDATEAVVAAAAAAAAAALTSRPSAENPFFLVRKVKPDKTVVWDKLSPDEILIFLLVLVVEVYVEKEIPINGSDDLPSTGDTSKPSTEPTDEPTDYDVLFGRGGMTNSHPGNRRFRDIISLHRPDYIRAIKMDKPAVAKKIVRSIRMGDPPGRFLKKGDDGKWYDVGDRTAAEKTSQGLRERSNAEKRQRSLLREALRIRKQDFDEKDEGPAVKKPKLEADVSTASSALNYVGTNLSIPLPALTVKEQSTGKTESPDKEGKNRVAQMEELNTEGLPPNAVDEEGNILVTDYDILCGRGGLTNHHKGNKRFRDIVALHRPDYVRAPKIQKPSVARVIVRAIRNGDPPGRFLKKDEKTGKWYDIGDKKAAEKTSQALREKTNEERDKFKRELGSSPTGVLLPGASSLLTSVSGAQGASASASVATTIASVKEEAGEERTATEGSENTPTAVVKQEENAAGLPSDENTGIKTEHLVQGANEIKQDVEQATEAVEKQAEAIHTESV